MIVSGKAVLEIDGKQHECSEPASMDLGDGPIRCGNQLQIAVPLEVSGADVHALASLIGERWCSIRVTVEDGSESWFTYVAGRGHVDLESGCIVLEGPTRDEIWRVLSGLVVFVGRRL